MERARTSPLSARNGFFGSKPYSQVNAALEAKGLPPIDWCLPNVLANNGRLTGAIDWSNGGYADRRYDIATGLWSLRRSDH